VLAVAGTVPRQDFPTLMGTVSLQGTDLHLAGRRVPVARGTPALLAAAVMTGEVLGQAAPTAFLAGDVGQGDGSRRLYEYLTRHLPQASFAAIAFHYLLPDVDWHNRVLFAVGEMSPRPLLIADAGFMYVAKMSGQAGEYDLFTPDAGELAFLADETAPHPFYTRGFILHEDNRVPDLIARAYAHHNAAGYLLVKGTIDYLAGPQGILATVAQPHNEAMEAIGGTGDTLTGIVAALIAGGWQVDRAAMLAARTNRLAGSLAHPTPATQVVEIINYIPQALEQLLKEAKMLADSG